MAEIILSPFLQVLFEKLASKAESAVNQYLVNKKRRKELPETIERWKAKLGEMEAVLSDAEHQQFRSKAVQKWLHDLQDWAYDLEDILDEFATDVWLKELSQEEDDSPATCSCSPFNKVPGFLTCNSEASNLDEKTFLTKIEEINNRLEVIMNRARTLNLIRQSPSREDLQKKRPETTSLPPPVVFGRDDEKRKIIKRLLIDEPCSENYETYMVIPIVGQGGIGKTTLAQSVYNDPQVQAHFDIKAWVCVSDVFDVQQITTTIIINSTNNHVPSDFNNLNEAQEKLQDILLSSKRFLIVLDDVWSDEYDPWQRLQTPFQSGSKGSRVIVTTRIDKVACNMLTRRTAQSPVVNLKGLSDDECWSICKQHALVCDAPIEIRTQVMELSKGLPLAAKALGGLLKKNDRRDWSTVLRSNIWSEEASVLPALRLSYYHLPCQLKRVFAYCSIFPKGHQIVEDYVVLMWMAEGFLPESKEESMENKGHSYFGDLVSRSLFEPCRKGYFIMHDLIHDLAQWVAGDVCCRAEIDKATDRTRFMSFTNDLLGRECLLEDEVARVGRQMRTFAAFGRYNYFIKFDLTFQQFRCLRVLCIARMGITELPSYIGELKYLRLLDLSFNRLNEVPESMSKLCNLQSLVLKGCSDLTKVLNMDPFIEIRHLDIKGSGLLEMPPGFGKLTNLRTSRQYIINTKSGARIRDLENLNRLCGSLDIFGLENVTSSEDAERARLNEKLHLEILRMFWETLTYRVEKRPTKSFDKVHRVNQVQPSVETNVLNQLQPSKYLKELVLEGYKGLAFPDWLGSPSFNKMVVLRLKGCSECEWLPPLGQLPALEELLVDDMSGIKIISLEFYGVGCLNPFPKLKTLRIYNMKHLEEWLSPSSVDNNRAFPCLEKLSLRSCPLLQGYIPSFLPSLKTLKIINCDKMQVTLPSCPLLHKYVNVRM